MKFSLKTVALAAMATVAAAAPVQKRDEASARIISCFVGLIFTGQWPGTCQAAVAVDLGLIKSIAINQMSIDFTGSNPWAPPTSSSDVVATMFSIPGISLPITKVAQHIIISDNGKQIGSLDTPATASTVGSGGILKTSFPATPLNVFANSHAAFSQFIGALSTSVDHPLNLKGSVDATLNLGIFGKPTISGIGFNTQVPFKGLNNLKLKYLYLVETNFDVIGTIKLVSIIKINNPSALSLKLGDITLSTAAPGSGGYVGTSSIKGLSLVPGDNLVISTTDLDNTLPATNDFLSKLFVQDGPLELTGFASTSTNPALNAGLATLKSDLVVPAVFDFSQPYSKDWSLKILSTTTATSPQVQIKATFQSPYYGFPLKFVSAINQFQDNTAKVTGVTPQTENLNLFKFLDNLTFDVSGTGTVTVTFNTQLVGPFTAARRSRYQDLVTYGAANGKIPVVFNWLPTIIINNDGINRSVDWSTLTGNVGIAVGSDFANILNLFPTA